MLTFNADGLFSYTPNTGFSGEDQFTYRAKAGDAISEVATVTNLVQDETPDDEPDDEPEGEVYPIFFPQVVR